MKFFLLKELCYWGNHIIQDDKLNLPILRRLFSHRNRGLGALMARGASGTFILRVVNKGATFVIAILLARVLGASGYGVYSFAISWMLLLQIFTTLGLGPVIARNITAYQEAGEWGKIHGLMRFSFAAIFVASITCLLIAWAVLWYVYKGAEPMSMALGIVFILLPVNALMVPCESLLSAVHKVVFAQIPSFVVRPIIFIVFIGLLGFFFKGSISINIVLLLYVLSVVVSFLGAIFLCRTALDKRTWSVEPHYEIRSWVQSAIPLVFLGGMFLINSNIDIVMLTAMKDPQAAGIYKAAIKGAELVVLVFGMINAPLSPIVARLFAQKNTHKLQNLLTRSVWVALCFAILAAVPLIFFGSYFLGLFGSEFIAGHTALAILCCAQLFNVATGSASLVLIMGGQEAYAARATAWSVVVHVLLNIWLIPRWGLEGAAFATAGGIIILNILLVLYVWRLFKIDSTFLGLRP